jgi:succinate dehydrogenase hydrophobic anchor subunit
MTGLPPAARRFLGRPDEAYPGVVPDAGATSAVGGRVEPRSRSTASRLWLIQALSGGALLLFLGIHLVAQHFLAPGGLRDYAAVVAYFREPLAVAAELGLLVSVIVHACIGVRASLVDVLHDPTRLRIASIAIGLVGVLAGGYAIWLTFSVIGAGAAA